MQRIMRPRLFFSYQQNCFSEKHDTNKASDLQTSRNNCSGCCGHSITFWQQLLFPAHSTFCFSDGGEQILTHSEPRVCMSARITAFLFVNDVIKNRAALLVWLGDGRDERSNQGHISSSDERRRKGEVRSSCCESGEDERERISTKQQIVVMKWSHGKMSSLVMERNKDRNRDENTSVFRGELFSS